MAKKVAPIPEGYGSITPYLIVDGAARAIAFYKKAFGATERMRMAGADGKQVMHAELQFGDAVVMLADEFPEMGVKGPGKQGSPVSILFYVADVDKVFKTALKAGAKQVRPLADQFYGDRTGTLKDPFGHTWTVATHVEDVGEAELHARMAKMTGECGGCDEHPPAKAKAKAKPKAKRK